MSEAAELEDQTEDQTDDAAAAAAGEGEGEGAENEAPQSSEEAIRIAKLMGWKDPKNWQGAPPAEGLKSAEEFIAEQPKITRSLRKANESMKGKLDRVVATVAKLTDAQKRQMDEGQTKALVAAVEAGDTEGAQKILAEARADARRAEDASSKPAALADFEERNAEWYGTNDEATEYAVFLDRKLAAEVGGADKISDASAHMRRVEEGVKKRFPELFGEQKTGDDDGKPPQRRAPLVARGGGDRQRSSSAMTVADMSPAQRRAAKDMQVSEKDWVASWNQMQKAS